VLAAEAVTGTLFPGEGVVALKVADISRKIAKYGKTGAQLAKAIPAFAREAQVGLSFGAVRGLAEGDIASIPRKSAESAIAFGAFGAKGLSSPVARVALGTVLTLGPEYIHAKSKGEEFNQGGALVSALLTIPFLLGGIREGGGAFTEEFRSVMVKAQEAKNASTFARSLTKAEKALLEERGVVRSEFFRSVREATELATRRAEEIAGPGFVETVRATAAEVSVTKGGKIKVPVLEDVLKSLPEESPLRSLLSELNTQDLRFVRARAEERAAFRTKVSDLRAGYETKISELRQSNLSRVAQERAKLTFLEDVKQQAKRIVRETVVSGQRLPTKSQGKFVAAVANAKKLGDVEAVLGRVLEESVNVERRQIIQQIKAFSRNIKQSETIHPTVKRNILDILGAYSITNPSAKTLETAGIARVWMEAQIKAGKVPYLPKAVFNQMKVLEQVPLSDLSAEQLTNLLGNLKLLEAAGKDKYQMNQLSKALDTEYRIGKAMENIPEQISFAPERARGAGEPPSIRASIKQKWFDLKSSVKKADVAISPETVVFDTMDGGKKPYDGVLMNLFWKDFVAPATRFDHRRSEIGEKFLNIIKKYNLKQHNMERVTMFMGDRRAGVRDLLLATPGVTKEILESLKLTKGEMEVVKLAEKYFDEIYPQIKEVGANVMGRDVSNVKKYFPISNDRNYSRSQLDGKKVDNLADILLSPDSYGYGRTTLEAGFIQETTGKVHPVNLAFDEVFLNYVDESLYLVEMGEQIEKIRAFVTDPRIEGLYGRDGVMLLEDSLDNLAKMGRAGSSKVIPLIDLIRKNVGVGILGLRASTTLMQFTALANAGVLIGGEGILTGSLKTMDKEMIAFARNNSPQLMDRAQTSRFPEIKEFFMNGVFPNLMDKSVRASFKGMQIGDMWAATASWLGAYEKWFRDRGLEPNFVNAVGEAVKFAELTVSRTQAGVSFRDLPRALSTGWFPGVNNKSITKAMFQFQNFVLNNWSLVRHDIVRMGIRERNPLEASRKAFWLFVGISSASAVGVGTNAAIRGLTGDKDDRDLIEQYINRLTSEVGQTIPFVSPFISALTYGSMPVPLLDATNDALEGIVDVSRAKSAAAKGRAVTRLASPALSLLGVPGASQLSSVALQVQRAQQPGSRRGSINYLKSRIRDVEGDNSIPDAVKNLRLSSLRQSLNSLRTAP